MDIQVMFEVDNSGIDETFVQDVADRALNKLECSDNCEVSITFVDNERISELNEQYRGISSPTDVLSFECDNLDDDFPSFEDMDLDESEGSISASYSLGDIVIAPDVAKTHAEELDNGYEDEIALLIVHGLLHLLGYDHIESNDAKEMEALQADVLSSLGFNPPVMRDEL